MADEKEEAPDSPDVYFEPLVNLPPVDTVTLEEDEDQLVKLRAKLFRYDSVSDPPEWKERGVGDVKILKKRDQNICRIVMRRDKTLKICANHYVLSDMELKPNCGSDRAWVWNAPADFADEEPKNELLAIRFANADNAQKFKEKFEEAKKIMKEQSTRTHKTNGTETSTDKDAESVAEKLGEMTVKDAPQKSDDKSTDKESNDVESTKEETSESATGKTEEPNVTNNSSVEKEQAER